MNFDVPTQGYGIDSLKAENQQRVCLSKFINPGFARAIGTRYEF